MNAGLALLALRRTLSPAILLLWTALTVLSLAFDWAGDDALLEADAGASAPALARGMTREGVWTVFLLAVVPLLLVRAARAAAAWKAGDGEWLGSRPVSRFAVVVSTWLGTCAGATLLPALTCAAIELRTGPAGPSAQRAGGIALPPAAWIESRSPLVWRASDPGAQAPPGCRARVELAFASGAGSASEVELLARRLRPGGEVEERSSRARVASRGTVEVELPPGPGDLVFELRCPEEGARAFTLSETAELWAPCESERSASGRILLRLSAALLAWTALALGLGAWMSAPIAALALLAAWIPVWLGEASPAWWPGADLWSALDVAGAGRVPAAVDPWSLAVAAAIAAVGLGVGAAGLRTWRTTP